MTAQRGSELLIKLGDGNSPETFTTIGGLKTSSASFNSESIDVSDEGVELWRTLLAATGLMTASLSGAGVFKNGATEREVRSIFFTRSIRNYQLVLPGFGVLQGPFFIPALEYHGDHGGAVEYTMTFESADELSFTEF